MITASDAVLAAVGFFGFDAGGVNANRSDTATVFERDADRPASPDLLSPGEPAFEAVAEALRKTGYLDS